VEETHRWRWGVNRWIVLGLIVLNVIAVRQFSPILPHIQLPAEPVVPRPLFTLPVIGQFYLTNTLVATLIADVLLIAVGFSVWLAIRRGEMVLTGIAGMIEVAIEMLYDLTESTAGRWAKTVFPWMATIVLLVLLVNWMELLPGVDSIGFLHEVHAGQEGYPVRELNLLGIHVRTIVKGAAETSVGGANPTQYALVPYVRVASTDLNFTVALALTSVFMVQVFGVSSLGITYLSKFLYVKTLFSKPIFGVMDFAVGLLELVSEFSKILSFSFRLFGNLFAGSVLLFVIGSLVPVFAQTIFLALEFFVGLIQALVFGLLTMIFMSQATAGHAVEGEEHG
jgi:F-type H+-transporting ATPase subunit a